MKHQIVWLLIAGIVLSVVFQKAFIQQTVSPEASSSVSNGSSLQGEQDFYQQYQFTDGWEIKNRPIAPDPLLVVVIMVKNEEECVVKTLEPFLKAGIQSYLVLDTGSTDQTIQRVQQVFKDYQVTHGYIEERPFVDFATSRNHAVELAEQRFPKAGYLLMVDAEWYMQNVQGLLDFCKKFYQVRFDTFLVHKINNETDIPYPSLFRAHAGVRYKGVVHEILNKSPGMSVPKDVYFKWDPTDRGVNKSKQRWLRDLDLLIHEQEKNSKDTRTVFYLARTYDALQDYDNACYWYQRRCELSEEGEEGFMARYCLGKMYKKLNNSELAEQYYMQAYKMRPWRAEPLVQLAQHYCDNTEYDKAFYYALAATKVPLPKKDILLIEEDAYKFRRYDILGAVAKYIGEYKIGKEATLKALKIHPELDYLHENLAYYNQVA